MKTQRENPKLQYFTVTDDENILLHPFWEDVKSVLDYQEYDESVTFETTYKTNIYMLPLGLFCGVN